MSQKNQITPRLKNTLNELDTALEQWDRLTNKPEGEQASPQSSLQQKAKSLLNELRDQIEDFDSLGEEVPTPNPEN